MKIRTIPITILVSTICFLIGTSPIWAANQSPTGKVTHVIGTAALQRVGLEDTLTVRFRDNIFLRDKITTKEQSYVRVLLGGKALVTVRELSVLTITEEKGHATINMKSGIMALSVARERMKPGETIEVRTPHAIAAVRGTIPITKVTGTALKGMTQFGMVEGHMDAAGIETPTNFTRLNEHDIGTFIQNGQHEKRTMAPEEESIWERLANLPIDTPHTNTAGVRRAHQEHFQRTVDYAIQLSGEEEKEKKKRLLLLTGPPSLPTTNNIPTQTAIPVIPTQGPGSSPIESQDGGMPGGQGGGGEEGGGPNQGG